MAHPTHTNPGLDEYEHWNEEAAIVKAYEDRFSDYYAEPHDPNGWDD